MRSYFAVRALAGDVLIFGEASHRDDHDGVFVHRKVAGQIAGNVDGALHLGNGAFPDFGVAGGQIDQEVPGEEVGQVGREAHGQFLLKDLVNIDVEVFVGESGIRGNPVLPLQSEVL